MGFIYMITCSITGKVYIGQTTLTTKARWNRHKYDFEQYRKFMDGEITSKKASCSKLYKAMYEYGYNNFVFSVIEELDNDLLDDVEMQYIEAFDSVKNGYNLKSGGGRSSHCEETRKLISEKTKEGITKHIGSYRKHKDKLEGLPKCCVYIERPGKYGYAIKNHPKCEWISFLTTRVERIPDKKQQLIEFLKTLE